MDYSSIDSELIESLDFLRPPVKRVFRNTNKSTIKDLGSHVNNIKVLKDFRKRISKDCQFPQPKYRTAESSTSLILKKTTDREIVQRYSVLSYTDLLGTRFQNSKPSPTQAPVCKVKPLIKVTVIPKTAQNQNQNHLTNVLKRRKNLPKRIHSTVSNQENYIQTKNVYLVVKGRKREKVYEIKTTGSAKFTNNHSRKEFQDEVIPMEQLSSLKLVLDSLNMDRDREKDKKKRKKPDVENFLTFSSIINDDNNYAGCACRNNTVRGNARYKECTCASVDQEEATPERVDSRSRVRITGRLGLTQDDRYVLRCAATIDDKPVETDYTTIEPIAPYASAGERKFNDICNRATCINRCYNASTYCTQTRDCYIQADIQKENKFETPPISKIMKSKETQATQVDFSKSSGVTRCKNKFLNKDEVVQCCTANIETPQFLTDSDSDSNGLKASQSPLVIISVYPMQDCCEGVKVIKNYSDDSKALSPKKINVVGHNPQRPSSGIRSGREKRNDPKGSRSRSRSPYSPNRNVSKSNVTETRILKTNTRKLSPGREATQSANKPNKQIRSNQDSTFKAPEFNKKRPRGNSPQKNNIKETRGNNTNQTVTKKYLVDSYTKKLTEYLKSENGEAKFRGPKRDTSKVTVDIDGDNEYYNVLFQQANSTTDLNVRKTVKSNAKKKIADNVKGTSPTMKILLQHDELKKKLLPEQSKNQQKDDHKLKKTFSRLHVRDSIEISHRRDGKLSADPTVIKNTQNSRIEDDSGQFSAPIKHYRGDSCPIGDPIKRDKEIRALLGVDKGFHTSNAPVHKVEEKNFAVPLHYFYGKTCEKKIVTGINIMEMQDPPCVCCDIRKYYDSPSSNSHIEVQSPLQRFHASPRQTKSILSAKMSHSVAKRNKKVNATSSQIVKETAENKQSSSDSASPEEKNPSPEAESPSPVNESPSPLDDSPSPIEETPSPVLEKRHSKRLTPKAQRKSRSNSTGTQYETQVQRTSLYQQLILNRNIQVFLQVEQFSKQKPIILSRKQYDKVKRTIESTIANKTGRDYKRKKCICKTSLVSVGNVRRKPRTGQSLHKQSQTDKKELANAEKSSSVSKRSRASKRHNNTMVLYAKREDNINEKKAIRSPRQAMSSMEIQYASMSYMKRVTFSSTNVEAGSTIPPALDQKDSHSIHTIFKGHRKCPTPNLGTSVFSLYSEDNNANISPQPLLMAQESKQKKPFLRRLMSCLVMRSARASDLNNVISPPDKVPSVDSSIDSYHISTSMGAIEVSSSIYDTSASFYSNHSIYPINSKMKRGFFSSVREFLTIRKS